MASNSVLFAGLELSSGRKPVTLAGLDEDLNIIVLGKWDISETLSCLQDYVNSALAVNTPSTKQAEELFGDLKKQLIQAGFRSFSQKRHPKQWFETNAEDSFCILSGHKLWARRTLEGRLQRCAILYEQGLQVTDPVDMFEEITRYKLIQGILPLENLPSSRELDALAAAYVAWMSLNRPGEILPKGDFVLPALE